jgi:hypothetical protein
VQDGCLALRVSRKRGSVRTVSKKWWGMLLDIQIAAAKLCAEYLVPSFPVARSCGPESDSFPDVTKVAHVEPCTDVFLGKWAVHVLRGCSLTVHLYSNVGFGGAQSSETAPDRRMERSIASYVVE